MKTFGLAVVLSMATTVAATVLAAQNYTDVAYFRLEVNALPGQGNYEVITEPGYGPAEIWCWAGNYPTAYLRVPATTRVYLMQPLGPAQTRAGKKGVGFTVNPSAEVLEAANRPGDGGNYSVSVKRVGYNLSIGHTRNFCDLDLSSR